MRNSVPLNRMLPVLAVTFVLGAMPAAQTVAAPYAGIIRLAEMSGNGAARAVERATGGRVLSVHREENNGRVVYRVKVLLPEGRIRVFIVDAETGSVNG